MHRVAPARATIGRRLRDSGSFVACELSRYSLVAGSRLSCATACRLVEGGRNATHAGFSSTRSRGGRRGLALVDHVAAARTAERGRIDKTAIKCAPTIPPGLGLPCCGGPHTH